MASSSETLLDVRGLSVAYATDTGARICAVDDLSLTIDRGEIVGIWGESGCGKSTLGHAVLGLLPAHAASTQGNIIFNGCDLLQLPEKEFRRIRGSQISLVSQDPALSLNPVISVGTQIGEVLRAHLPLGATARRARVVELLSEVGFHDTRDIYEAYPHQLSGGQRQRISIAQAVACRPALVIADEPTSKLDAPLQAEIIALMAQIREKYGTSILLISHDPTTFAGFAERIAVMYAGRIIESGETGQIFRHPLHPYTQGWVALAEPAPGSDPRAHFRSIEGEPPDPSAYPHGCRFEPRCADRMEVCGKRYPQAFIPEPSRPVSCFKYGE